MKEYRTNVNDDNSSSTVVLDENGRNVEKIKEGVFLLKTFLFLALGLFITAGIALLGSFILDKYVFSLAEEDDFTPLFVFIVVLLVSFIVCFITSFVIGKKKMTKKGSSLAAFIIYSVCMGICLSSLVYFVNNIYLVAEIFGLAALLCGLFGLIGYFTKGKTWGIILGVLACLTTGIFVFTLISYFTLPLMMASDWHTYWVIYSVINGVYLLIFLIYTAIDVKLLFKAYRRGESSNNDAIYYGFRLYSDILVVFIYLLRFIIAIASAKNK